MAITERKKTNIMDLFRDFDNGNEVDINLIKKVAFNPEAYDILINELKYYDLLIDESFHQRLSILLEVSNITEIPQKPVIEFSGILMDESKNDRPSLPPKIRMNSNAIQQISVMPNEARDKIRILLENIALGKFSASDIILINHPYLEPYFTDDKGLLDINKINNAVYDPIISRNIINFFNVDSEISQFETWGDIFTDNKPRTLKQQAIEVKLILEFLSLQPEKIIYLGKISKERLSALFPSDYGFHHGDVLSLVNDPQELKAYNEYIDRFIINYNEDKIFFESYSLIDALKHTTNIYNQQYKNYVQLRQLSQTIAPNTKINIIELPLSSSESIHYLYSLTHPAENLAGQQGVWKRFFHTLSDLRQKQDQGILSADEQTLLKTYNHFYQRQLATFADMGTTVEGQSIFYTLSNLHNNQLTYIKGSLETYTVVSYSNNGKYHFNLLDSSGVEWKTSHVNFIEGRKQFLDMFNHYMRQQIKQPNGSILLKGQIAGFQQKPEDDLRGSVRQIDRQSYIYQNFQRASITKLQDIYPEPPQLMGNHILVYIGEDQISFGTLKSIGAKVDGVPLNSEHIKQAQWQNKLKFDANLLSVKLTLLEGNESDVNLLRALKNLIGDSEVSEIINKGATLQEHTVLKQQLKLLNKSDIDSNKVSLDTLNRLRTAGVKLPIYSRIANRTGQFMGGVGIFMSINSIYQLLDELDNPNLSEKEIVTIKKNLTMACASAFFNYGDMVLQPILLKVAYKQANSFNASTKFTARLTILFNLISMGLDIYQACDAFEQLDKTTNSKERQDLIVSGSLSIANVVIGGLTVVGIFIGSSTIPVIGLAVGAVLLVGGMIYNGIRAVERIEDELGEELSWDEKAREGIRAAFGFKPSDNILNHFSKKQHIAYFKNKNWQHDLDFFKASYLYQGFEENLQFVEKPILGVENKYYIMRRGSSYLIGRASSDTMYRGSDIIDSTSFEKKEANSPLMYIDKDDVGPCYTINQINHIRSNYSYHEIDKKWYKIANASESKFNIEFRLVDKEAPLSYKEIGRETSNDILVLNSDYESDLLSDFTEKNDLSLSYKIQKEKSVLLQIQEASAQELRLFRAKNQYNNLNHPDFNENEEIKTMGNEYINQSSEIAEKLLSKNPEIIYENLINASVQYEEKAVVRDISFNSGGGTDIIIGKKNARNAFNYTSGSQFFAGGIENDIFNISLQSYQLDLDSSQIYLDGNGGDDILIIKDIPVNSLIEIDLNKQKSLLNLNQSKIKELYFRDVTNVMLRGSRKGNYQLLGNKKNNLLDAGTGHSFIYGGEGDDQIIFESGMVNGDIGNDIYYLRRFDWDSYFEERRTAEYKIHLAATILEVSESQSEVNLGYSLDEIEEVSLSGNDLLIKIKTQPDGLSQYIMELDVTLKNVTINKNSKRQINHQYRLRTRDGFILSNQLSNIGSEQPHVIKKNIFNITYQQDNDSLFCDTDESTVINEEQQIITIGNKRVYQKPSWGEFNFIGLIKKLTYQGTEQDDQLLMVDRNSKILVSKGSDIYQISPEQYLQGRLVFDFSHVQGEYTENDRLIIALPCENGYDLQVDGQSIYLENLFGDKKLQIDFINYEATMAKSIIIQDGNSNLFQIKLSVEGHKIIAAKTVNPATNKSDHISLPMEYNHSTCIIDAQDGDDFIDNNSGKGYLINGGAGNDIIKAASGFNVLYGGRGDNFIYGGSQSDLILSDLGNDILNGGADDDNYIVDGRTFYDEKGLNTTLIIDDEGVNNLYLLSFSKEYQDITEENIAYRVYTSLLSQRTVKIKLVQSNDQTHMNVHHYDQLPQHIPSSYKEDMSHFLRYLAEQKQSIKQLNPLLPWQPMDEFKSAFAGNNFSPIKLSTPKVYIKEDAHFRQLVLNTKGQEQKLWDKSGQGRVLKAGAKNGAISVMKGNNVLYAAQGENNLYGGDGDDVIISNGNDGMLSDSKGKNIFIINGEKKGGSYIHSYGGQNTVYLINFKPEVVRERPEHIDNRDQYTYESESGHRVVFFQYPNTQAPTIIRLESLASIEGYSIEQSLEYLANTLASMRIQDEYNSIGNDDVMKKDWNPVGYVENFMKRAS